MLNQCAKDSVENSTVRIFTVISRFFNVDFLNRLCSMIMMAATHFSPVRAGIMKEDNGRRTLIVLVGGVSKINIPRLWYQLTAFAN